MGQPKALLRAGGAGTWLRRALELLASQGALGLRVAGGDPDWVPRDLEPAPVHLPDACPGQGPLAGLEAALAECPAPWILVLACDLPRVDAELIHTILAGRAPGVSAVVPRTPQGLEPLVACYSPRLLPLLRAYLQSGRRSAQGFLGSIAGNVAAGRNQGAAGAAGRVVEVALPQLPALLNVNTPAELAALTRAQATPNSPSC